MQPDQGRWESSRALAGLVRAIAWLGPIFVSFLAARVLAGRLRSPSTVAEVLLWWGAVIGASLLTFRVAERGARRLLPLAALLRLSMAFPDKAPSRFKIARTAGSVRQVHEQLEYLARRHDGPDPGRAAEIILSLVSALGSHDRRTRGHSERTRVYTDLLAEELDLPRHARDRLRWAALLHDIGKLKVANEILNKDGRPDEDEWGAIKRHPVDGARLIGPLRAWLGEWAQAVEHHHERFDGTGYPEGLAAEEISLAGRIVAVADAFETMTAARPYKKPMPVAAARQELVDCAGTHFDPAVVRAFLNVSLGRSRWLPGFVSSIAQTPFASGVQRFTEQLALVTRTVTAGVAVVGGAAAVTAASPSPIPEPVPITVAIADPDLLRPSPAPVAFPAGPSDTEPQLRVPQPLVLQPSAPPPTADPEPTPAPGLAPQPKHPPAPAADVVETPEDRPVAVDVLANDADADGDLDPTTLEVNLPPAAGSASVTATSEVRYIPNADAWGADLFRYRVCDATGLCDTAAVYVTVTPVDDPPRPTSDAAMVAEDGSVTVDVLANDVDPDSNIDAATLEIVAGPSHGSADIDPVSRRIKYSPEPDYHGSDAMTYRICDATALCREASLLVTVTPVDDPFSPMDDDVTTDEDTAVGIVVIANDVDVDGGVDPTSVTITTAASVGAAEVDGATGEVTYTPDPDVSGGDSFAYRACATDGDCGIASVTITIVAVNDPPVTVADSLTTAEDTLGVVDVLANDSDPDGDPLTVGAFDVVSAQGGSVSCSAGSCTYSPPSNFHGADSFAYAASDGTATTSGSVAVTVTGINDPPTPQKDFYKTNIDVPASFNVLGNDTDPDGDPLTVSSYNASTSKGGSVSCSTAGACTYTPPIAFAGIDQFNYTVDDGKGGSATAKAKITVKATDAPTANSDTLSTAIDTAIIITVLANDTPGANPLDASSVAIVEAASHGVTVVNGDGTITYTPSSGWTGLDVFQYQVCDTAGKCDTAVVYVTVG